MAQETLPLPLYKNPPRGEFRLRIMALGVSIRSFALLWGLGVQTIYGWTNRKSPKYPPPYAWRMLALTEANPALLHDLSLMPPISKERT